MSACGVSARNSSNISGRLSSALGRRKPYSTSVSLRARSPLNMPADLRQRDVRLVDDDEEILGEIVEQARRPLARLPAREVARVVLDAGAGADLEHHLDVEVRARLEALRLEQLARAAQERQPLGELGADERDRALERRARRDEMLRRIDRRAFERSRSSSPVSGLIFEIRSISSPHSSMRTACSSYAGKISTVSPRTRKVPRSKATSLREYWIFTSARRMSSRLIVCADVERDHRLAVRRPDRRGRRSRETVATMMTSSRSMSYDVARSRSRSMSSLIDASFSMYVSLEGTYASGW